MNLESSKDRNKEGKEGDKFFIKKTAFSSEISDVKTERCLERLLTIFNIFEFSRKISMI